MAMSDSPVCMTLTAMLSAVTIAALFVVVYVAQSPTNNLEIYDRRHDNHQGHVVHEVTKEYVPEKGIVPEILFNRSIYNGNDFRNPAGIVPAYWGANAGDEEERHSWGPCYWPSKEIHWKTSIEKYGGGSSSNDPSTLAYSKMKVDHHDHGTIDGMCRPGFLIIGQGKCGTSSLYHYLTSHPRVLPAKKKQIHYFLYYAKQYALPWYLKHFPTTASFLASGGIMSGEASPGYMPYPDIPNKIKTIMPGPPRIVAIGRNPLERAYSSYKYNYKAPLLTYLRAGKVRGIDRRQEDEYYEPYIFSFEEMLRAELPVLRECLGPDGYGAASARDSWGNESWAKHEFARRDRLGLPPLIALDNHCYGSRISNAVPRRQWADLLSKNPEKVITSENVHLTQSMIGRSLYTLPLEWWYFQFEKSDLHFICTEELDDLSGAGMHKLGEFLGLPFFNFSSTLSEGAYNVGVNTGYDKQTKWGEVEKIAGENRTIYSKAPTTVADIPLSDEFVQELKEFITPYNERLFKLVGHRCNWW